MTLWTALQGRLVSALLLVGMGFLGRDLLYYLQRGRWDWTVVSDVLGEVRTGWPGLDGILGLFLSLHVAVFCVVAAWVLGQGRQSGRR